MRARTKKLRAENYWNRKSQAWFPDFALSVFIFIGMLAFFLFYLEIRMSEARDIRGSIPEDANLISNVLVEAGYPANWNSSDVYLIGLTDGHRRINATKVGNFAGLDYTLTRRLFATQYEYLVFFQDNQGNVKQIGGISEIGKPGVTAANIDDVETGELSRVGRLLIFPEGATSSIVEMVGYIWKEK